LRAPKYSDKSVLPFRQLDLAYVMRLSLRSGILLEPPFPEYFPFINTGVDDPNAGYFAAVGDRHAIDSRPSARWAKFRSPVLSDDLFDAGLVSVRDGLKKDDPEPNLVQCWQSFSLTIEGRRKMPTIAFPVRFVLFQEHVVTMSCTQELFQLLPVIP